MSCLVQVKVVREVMNQMLEAWKQIPDVFDECSPPPQSQASSKENASDGRYPPVVQSSCAPSSVVSIVEFICLIFCRFVTNASCR
ncbi:hypothetical protein K1719_003603 [Acacia pycnantha]|nr:hypothetical protein K1719_003603 [Acacia pycnantha]